jgi:hypothetical protein
VADVLVGYLLVGEGLTDNHRELCVVGFLVAADADFDGFFNSDALYSVGLLSYHWFVCFVQLEIEGISSVALGSGITGAFGLSGSPGSPSLSQSHLTNLVQVGSLFL